jgi:hypothetical protein
MLIYEVVNVQMIELGILIEQEKLLKQLFVLLMLIDILQLGNCVMVLQLLLLLIVLQVLVNVLLIEFEMICEHMQLMKMKLVKYNEVYEHI